jgi:hypothetical protein
MDDKVEKQDKVTMFILSSLCYKPIRRITGPSAAQSRQNWINHSWAQDH